MPAYYLEALTVTLGLVMLLAESFVPSKQKSWVGFAGAIGLALILVATFFAIGSEPKMSYANVMGVDGVCNVREVPEPKAEWQKWPLWNFYQFDSLARFFKIFALLTTILVLLMAIDYRKILSRYTENPDSENGTGEYYCLPIFACAGMMWMASAKDLAGAFVALELVTITFYILVAFMRRNAASLEAGAKFLILGALSTGFLVYGIAWVYGTTGTMNLSEISNLKSQISNPIPLLFGIALVLVALGFKVGAFPMQMWIPDVYQGAPTPTTAFLSVGSKAAGFILLIRFLTPFLADNSPVRSQVLTILLILAGATLLYGNLAAIPQTNFKRLLAYSSIAHAGFLILALAAWAPGTDSSVSSVEAVSFYLATYLIMTMGVFFVLAQIRIHRDGEAITDFNGLGKSNPLLAMAMTVLLAALAGVPLTAGFIGKFFVFQLAAGAHLWAGLAIAVIAAAAGFYYYFKTIRAMWWIEASDTSAIPLPCISKIAIATLTALTLVFGVYPAPILALLK